MTEITFIIARDELDGGFNARAHWTEGNRDIFTQGDSREQLLSNIRDAIGVSFSDNEVTPAVIRCRWVKALD